MIDSTTYGLGQILTSPLIMIGLALILGGGSALVWMYRDALGYREPEIPSVVQPPVEQTYIHPVQPVAANYRRPDSDTGVVARIPGATPQAGPVCPVCGGPFGNCECYSQKSSTEETVTLPVVPPVAELSPQFAALSRFFTAVDEARADTDQAMRRLAANARPDCPLTTVEIPTLAEPADPPEYRAASERLGDTRELSAVMKKVSAP